MSVDCNVLIALEELYMYDHGFQIYQFQLWYFCNLLIYIYFLLVACVSLAAGSQDNKFTLAVLGSQAINLAVQGSQGI